MADHAGPYGEHWALVSSSEENKGGFREFKQRVTSSDSHVTTLTPAGVWQTDGGNAHWRGEHPVTQDALAGERCRSSHMGEAALEVHRKGQDLTNTWRIKQNRNLGLIGHDDVEIPGLGRLVTTERGSLGQRGGEREGERGGGRVMRDSGWRKAEPAWGGKVVKAVFSEMM